MNGPRMGMGIATKNTKRHKKVPGRGKPNHGPPKAEAGLPEAGRQRAKRTAIHRRHGNRFAAKRRKMHKKEKGGDKQAGCLFYVGKCTDGSDGFRKFHLYSEFHFLYFFYFFLILISSGSVRSVREGVRVKKST